MKRIVVVLSTVLLLCLIGWGYTYRLYQKQWKKPWGELQYELSHTASLLNIRQDSDLPYDGKTEEQVLEMLPPPDSIYLIKYYQNLPAVFYEVWGDLLKDGMDTVRIKVFEWEFDHRVTNLSNLHIDFVEKDGKWIEYYSVRWDPEVVMF